MRRARRGGVPLPRRRRRQRPAPDAGLDAFYAYVFERDIPKGWHREWWQHVHGCRRFIKVVRHTVTHEIAAVGRPEDDLAVPE